MQQRKDRAEALNLRLQGKTYGEIRAVLNVPKSTLSTWFKNLSLPEQASVKLKSKQGKGLLALAVFNQIRTQAIQKQNVEIRQMHEMQVGTLNKREFMLIGAALYWAEGYKNFNHARKSYPYINFANTDPFMNKVFIYFLEQILEIPRADVRAIVYGYPNTPKIEAINYWHRITQISKRNFRFLQLINKASAGKRNKNLLPYGTLQLRVSHRQEFFKIQGLIDGIAKSII